MRMIKLFICMVFTIQILFITGCSKDEKTLIDNEKFNEEIVFEEQRNPESEGPSDSMSLILDKYGELALENTFSQDVYFSEDGEVVFYFDNRYFEEDANFEDWYIEKRSKNGEQVYKIYLSEVDGVTAEKFSGQNVDWDVDAWWPAEGGEIFPLENGNVMLTIYYDKTMQVLEINPSTKELVSNIEYELYNENGDRLSLLFITEKYTVFTNNYAGDIFFYNNSTGEVDVEDKTPGYEADEFFGTSKFRLYDGYWYMVNDAGIYRSKYDEMKWESVINASETVNVAYDFENTLSDILVLNQNEIYVLKINEYSNDGTNETVRIIKFEIY